MLLSSLWCCRGPLWTPARPPFICLVRFSPYWLLDALCLSGIHAFHQLCGLLTHWMLSLGETEGNFCVSQIETAQTNQRNSSLVRQCIYWVPYRSRRDCKAEVPLRTQAPSVLEGPPANHLPRVNSTRESHPSWLFTSYITWGAKGSPERRVPSSTGKVC